MAHEQELIELLEQYHHYKHMSPCFLRSLREDAGMSLYDFMQWLKSREKS